MWEVTIGVGKRGFSLSYVLQTAVQRGSLPQHAAELTQRGHCREQETTACDRHVRITREEIETAICNAEASLEQRLPDCPRALPTIDSSWHRWPLAA